MVSINVLIIIFGSVLITSIISLVGVFFLNFKKNSWLVYFVSFSAGSLFGDAFLHLIPNSFESNTKLAGFHVLLGITIFFVLEKFIRWHHCHSGTEKQHKNIFGYMNLVGDGMHNFVDGIIIAGTYMASIPLGIATTLAVIFHEIPQEISDFGVLLKAGFTKKRALTLNFLSALVSVLGAITALLLTGYIENIETVFVPFTAGGFIYIAGSDLIPELHKNTNTKKSLIQLTSFLAGILVMALLLLLE